MTAKLTASADGRQVIIGTAAENALQIDAVAKRVRAIAPYQFEESVLRVASMVRLNTSNANGSVNTAIRRFANIQESTGGDITYADSATLGALFVVNTSGVYSISYSDSFPGASGMGISLDAIGAELATTVFSLSSSKLLTISQATAINVSASCSWTGYLPAGASIRPHTTVSVANSANPGLTQFTIARVVTDATTASSDAPPIATMIRLQAANGHGTVNTAIRRFSNLISQQGTDITYADSATLGGSFTINTAGVYSFSYNDQFNAASGMGLSLNTINGNALFTTLPASEMLSSVTSASGAFAGYAGWTGYLNTGDVVRAHTNKLATGGNPPICQFTATRIIADFPQANLSEPPASMVRVGRHNGFGSTGTRIPRFGDVIALQGDDITYVDSVANGASFTINKAGVYAMSYTDFSVAGEAIVISLNSSSLTTNGIVLPQAEVACSVDTGANRAGTCSTSLYLAAGTIVRPQTSGTTSNNSVNRTMFSISRVVPEMAPAILGSNPIGTIIDWAGTAAPPGYFACPLVATNISRITYAALFKAIGTTWGAGDGSTTFGMPFFPADYAGIQANANVGTQSVGSNLSHTHTIPGYGAAGGGANFTTASGVSTIATGASGGTANLAAGMRVMKCVKVFDDASADATGPQGPQGPKGDTGETGAPGPAFNLPTGTIIDFAASVAPAGYLACPNVATDISRVTYANLFAVIGTAWGAGDGSTTFGMPWFTQSFAAVAAGPSNVALRFTGAVREHTHAGSFNQAAGVIASGVGVGAPGATGGISGGGSTDNFAAGVHVRKCVKL